MAVSQYLNNPCLHDETSVKIWTAKLPGCEHINVPGGSGMLMHGERAGKFYV